MAYPLARTTRQLNRQAPDQGTRLPSMLPAARWDPGLSALVAAGATVQVVMSEAAEQFITAVTLQALTNRHVYTSQWDTREPTGAGDCVRMKSGGAGSRSCSAALSSRTVRRRGWLREMEAADQGLSRRRPQIGGAIAEDDVAGGADVPSRRELGKRDPVVSAASPGAAPAVAEGGAHQVLAPRLRTPEIHPEPRRAVAARDGASHAGPAGNHPGAGHGTDPA